MDLLPAPLPVQTKAESVLQNLPSPLAVAAVLVSLQDVEGLFLPKQLYMSNLMKTWNSSVSSAFPAMWVFQVLFWAVFPCHSLIWLPAAGPASHPVHPCSLLTLWVHIGTSLISPDLF